MQKSKCCKKMAQFQLFLTLITLFVASTRVATETDTCSGIDIKQLQKDYHCDGKLIASVANRLKKVQNINKGLSYRLTKIRQSLVDKCPDALHAIKGKLRRSKTKLSRSCFEAMQSGSGIYKLRHLDVDEIPMRVYCLEDPKHGRPWTVIHRRIDDNVNFNRLYEDYVYGFGDILTSFWLGLENIHRLTYEQPFELWVQLTDFNNYTHSAMYDQFAVSGAETKYTLKVLGDYTGSIGDSLKDHVGRKFSTEQEDNGAGANCAKKSKSGWWFANCGTSNLNGQYLKGYASAKATGFYWQSWRGESYSYKSGHMAIREIVPDYCG